MCEDVVRIVLALRVIGAGEGGIPCDGALWLRLFEYRGSNQVVCVALQTAPGNSHAHIPTFVV